MTSRTSMSTVIFASPFMLDGLDAPQPAGQYRIERDEEMIEGLSWLAWQSVATFIHLPAIETQSMTRQMLRIDPADLETAIEKDREPS